MKKKEKNSKETASQAERKEKHFTLQSFEQVCGN